MARTWNLSTSAPDASTIDDPTDDEAAPSGSPGGYQQVPASVYDLPGRRARAFAPRTAPPGFAANDARRQVNAAAREARITDRTVRSEDQLDRINQVNEATGRPAVAPGTSGGQIALDMQKARLMAQTPATRAAAVTRGQADLASQPHNPYAIPSGRAAALAAARRKVAMDPASQVGTGGQMDPTRVRTPGERMASIAPNLGPDDAIAVRSGNSVAMASNPASDDGASVPTVTQRTGTGVVPARARGGTVSEDGGKTWKPIGQATRQLADANAAEASIYDAGRVRAQQARNNALPPKMRRQIRADVFRDMGAPDPQAQADPYRRRSRGTIPSPV